ncbi:T-cell surface glycoprotein CD8 alpha chain-like isoform X4 [Numida meleagris]|uniref:T-cell surface glycoprotein CD8 alpha chain-like isoform X4 n=1 Tax=Numida meleagris TaxID=8996 RepID=UPI000B3DE33A|nr:T-cell surface glycoprotein CD8 alpha chain-like isoform X4 [Numida meleagris]
MGHGRLLPTGCTSTQGQRDTVVIRFQNRNMKHPQEGQRLQLECRTYRTTWGASWVRLDKNGNLHFIVSSNSLHNTVFHGNTRMSPHFEASWKDNTFWLVVKSFRAQDEGIYFCISKINQVLSFSSGQPAFLPVAITAAPTTPAATTHSSQVTSKDISWHSPHPAEPTTPTAIIQSSHVTKKDNSQRGADAETSIENKLNSTCEVFLWVRVAGTCLLLLTAITITITLCQSKSHPHTLQSFLQPHTKEHSPLLQGNGLSAYCPHAAIAYPGHFLQMQKDRS